MALAAEPSQQFGLVRLRFWEKEFQTGLAQTKSQPEAARTAPPKTAAAIVSLRMTFGVHHSHHVVRHSRTTRSRLHLLARIASFLSFDSSRQSARLAFGGIRHRPDGQGDPCKQQTMSNRLVAATNHRAPRRYS